MKNKEEIFHKMNSIQDEQAKKFLELTKYSLDDTVLDSFAGFKNDDDKTSKILRCEQDIAFTCEEINNF